MMSVERAERTAHVQLDQLPDGVVVVDAAGVVRQVNQAAEELVGQPRAELLGQLVTRVLPLQDSEGRGWWDTTDPLLDQTSDGQAERVLLLPTPDGPIELLATVRYVRSEPIGSVISVVIGLRDATARYRMNDEEHGILISTVAHELRSPLTSVKGFTATLLRRWERFTDDQKRFMLETIEHDADRVTRLIAELLDISRIDAGRLEVRRQLVDVAMVARRHIDRMRASEHSERRFVLRVSEDLPQVWADPDRLDQVLSNLLENAVRHGAGTVTLDAVVTLNAVETSNAVETLNAVETWEQLADRSGTEDGGVPVVVVTVSDEGEGIAEQDRPLVFTRFWQGNRRGGTGLGLYLVRGLVEAHGGRIEVDRAPSGGARFRFTLPASVPEHLG
ncbi:MAG: PAS domain-containing sensor histidine kinase [Angustibacter sp.]